MNQRVAYEHFLHHPWWDAAPSRWLMLEEARRNTGLTRMQKFTAKWGKRLAGDRVRG